MKGVTYQLKQFLGPLKYTADTSTTPVDATDLQLQEESSVVRTLSSEAGSLEKTLYHIIIYLAPGDYHHFHSPANWNVALRRHFPGMHVENETYLPFIYSLYTWQLW